MTLIDEIKKRSVHVDDAINELLPVAPPEELYKASRYLVDAGGKRLRPAVLILAAEAVGSDLKSVLPAAVAVELVHNFTLIHDDIMDRDDIRRGRPAVHKIWGEAGAILAGDTLYSKAFEILSKVENEPVRILKCMDILSKTCTEICEGQWLDMDFERREKVSKAEYIEMVEKKTSVLYAAAAKIGALLGGASDEVAEALSEYGRLIGIGFQMYDDVLDMVAPEEVLGKVRGSDLMEGKHTLIIIDAFEKGVKLDIFGKGEATQEETDEAVRILTECGSIDYVKNLAISYINEGKAKLDVLQDCPEKDLLLQIADYMITRKY
ncbi:MAG: polyprenyl synthetase family protein [Methanosarcina thermophila]|nr:polyprenyl synthetase family protein [Methanosarcina thermophila]ALK05125.1 MAG: phosphoesterase [Methanosarcina sp. 795]AKB13879.1 Geranylfarnesyl diphosphate synthase [Methanosarcina thermophila TM-1]AKB15481.1 Geranylfarnesyl diphosphate synthase [Methanosarcina thermophila CHTI-55]NLU56350.1 polyprenyl synthetase family protein [Methanosarcina thermophila]BAW28915.1 farnesyl-diphosphate synthase / geranylgeranyl-diphosphate synthase [Methanosarcina thermophila]